jgi:sulfite reductase (NADPH) flavoprotein alpha-component
VRGLVLKIHLVIALITGTFMVVLGTTGSIIAFEPELDRLLHPDLSYVVPTGRSLSLVEIGDAAGRKYGGEPIVAFLPPESPHVPAEVIMPRGIVAVNQYTGEILGVRTRGQTFLGFIRALHVRLATGDAGRNVVRWSAAALLFSISSGLYLWWPLKRVRIRSSWWSRGFWFDLHNALGIFFLLPFMVLAGTGAVMGFEDEITFLLDKPAGSGSVQVQTIARSEPAPGAIQITPDQAVAIASARLPGAVPYRVQMPKYGGSYVVALTFPDGRIAGERNSISIDPWNGKIISTALSAELTHRERFMAVNESIHTGTIFGTPSRVIVAMVSILLPIQAVSGLIMWFRRARIVRPN